MMDISRKKILVTGASGFIGAYLLKILTEKYNVPRKYISAPNFDQFDLRNLEACKQAVSGQDIVIHLAARVGGSVEHVSQPGTILYDNALMSLQLMECAKVAGVEKLVAIGSIACYPQSAQTPYKENLLLTGLPQGYQAPYAFAKLSSLIQARTYRDQYGFNAIFLVLPNLYGPPIHTGSVNASYVIPKFTHLISQAQNHNLALVRLQGNPSAAREFMHVRDAARGILEATRLYNSADPLNLGSDDVVKIGDLAAKIAKTLAYKGELNFEQNFSIQNADVKSLDTTKAKKELAFRAEAIFENELAETITAYAN